MDDNQVVIKCTFCNLTFESMVGLIDHEKNIHPDLQIYTNFFCAINECSQSFRYLKQYIDHLKSEHTECDLNLEEHNFDSTKEFCKWKKSIETNTSSPYMKNASGEVKTGVLIIFRCNRNGNLKRKLKTCNAARNKSCPASMFVLVNPETESCNVKFYSKHIGHDAKEDYIDYLNNIMENAYECLKNNDYSEQQLDKMLQYTEEMCKICNEEDEDEDE